MLRSDLFPIAGEAATTNPLGREHFGFSNSYELFV